MSRLIRSIAISVFCSCVGLAWAEAPFTFAATPGNLPKHIVPTHYAVRIEPSIAKDSFRGSVTIEVEIRKPARQIILHAKALTITKARLLGTPDVMLEARLDPEKEMLTLALPEELPVGSAKLAVEFSGKLTEQPQGLYITRYPTKAGEKRALITQCEATDARRIFPCWDEPVFRARFQLTVVVPEDDHAVSNMPIERETKLADGLKEVAFAASPSMSSYLLAFCTGKFEVIEDEADGVKLRVFTTEGKREQGRYAMEATKLILPWFNKYFGVKYPLPQLDQLSFPSTAAGGMENWGCIIYSDTAFLYDPVNSSQRTKETAFEVIAHEIAHQWFGNLVTMAWWDNLWLNEGFASWMGTKATDHFNPEWKSWLRAAGDKEGAMRLDARATTHPIQQPIERESQVNDIFDTITYNKGQAFLRMLESWLGETEFRDGMRLYMKRHAYSNTTSADLWAALGESSGQPVAQMAAGWTEQPGFPLVTVAIHANELKVAQEHFIVNQNQAAPRRWSIPIIAGWLSGTKSGQRFFLDAREATFPLAPAGGDTMKLNWGDAGYYRVAYERGLLDRIVAKVTELPEADRLNLVNDLWAAVSAGREPISAYLDLIARLRDETSYAVLSKIIGTLGEIDFLARGTAERSVFHAWARSYLRPHLQRIGLTPKANESPLSSLLRGSLVGSLGTFEDQSVIREAGELFRKFVADPSSVTGDLRGAVLAVVGQRANDETYETLHRLARAETSTEDKRRLYGALAASRNPKHASQTLALAITDELDPRGATRIVQGVAEDGEQPAAAWDFAREHLAQLMALLPSIRSYGYAPSLFTAFSEEARADELADFAREKLPRQADYEVAKALDEIRFKAKLKKRLLPEVATWCGEHL